MCTDNWALVELVGPLVVGALGNCLARLALKLALMIVVLTVQCYSTIVCSHSLLTSSRIKGVNCVECKLLHCEYRASRGVDYQTMPLQCIVFFGSICSQHAI